MNLHGDGYRLWHPGLPAAALENVRNFVSEALTTNGQVPVKTRLDALVVEVGRTIGRAPPFRALLGGRKVYMHMPPMARVVCAGDYTAAVPAHRDCDYNQHIAGPFLTVWLPLTDIDEKCGGLAVYPCSHYWGGKLEREPDGPVWLGAVKPPPGVKWRREVLTMPAGTVVIMRGELVHASMPNVSDHERVSLDFRFFNEHSMSSKPSLEVV